MTQPQTPAALADTINAADFEALLAAATPSILPDLWREAKRAEDISKSRRTMIEDRMVGLITTPDAGEGTITLDDALSVKYSVTRSVDTDKLTAGWIDLSENAQKCFRFKAEINKKEFDAAKSMSPATYAEFSACITTKPARPAFTLKKETAA
jgi:hypothetical protein